MELLNVELESAPVVDEEVGEGSFGMTSEATAIAQKKIKPHRVIPEAIFFWLQSVFS